MGSGYNRGKSMAINKKAVFFTFIAILLSAIIILSFVIHTEYRLRNKMFVIETRIDTLNDFVQDVEKDLERGLYIASFRAILALEQYILENGIFLDDLSSDFEEALLYGELNNSPVSIIQGASFTDWTEKIKEEAEKIDIAIDFEIKNVSIYHISPWAVSVAVNVSFGVSDVKETGAWQRDRSILASIDIYNFEDPLYTINSYGRVVNTIRKTPVKDYINESGAAGLRAHLNASYYIASATAPSFLMRFENNLSSSPYGIESLVNLVEFNQQSIPPLGRSAVDYMYFGDMPTTDLSCADMPSWFELDTDHAHWTKYECDEYVQ